MVVWKEMKAGSRGRRAEMCVASEHEKAKDEIVRTCRVFKLRNSQKGISASPSLLLGIARIYAKLLVPKHAPGAGTGMVEVKSWSDTAETFANRLDAEEEAMEKQTVPRVWLYSRMMWFALL